MAGNVRISQARWLVSQVDVQGLLDNLLLFRDETEMLIAQTFEKLPSEVVGVP